MTDPLEELLGDSLFQVNFVLWMLQPANGTAVRPLLYEAGYRLKAIERPLPLGVEILDRLKLAGLNAKQEAAPDLLLIDSADEHVLVECKRKMFGAQLQPKADDGHLRQARSYLVQTASVLSSSLGGEKVSRSHVLYLTRNDPAHDQYEGLKSLAKELTANKFDVAGCCLLRLVAENGGVAVAVPKKSEQCPRPLATVFGKRRKAITVLPRDKSGNDLRPLYPIPWMPDSEAEVNEYNARAFGNRVLGAAVTRFGRSPVDEDVILNVDELLSDATMDLYRQWRNKDTAKKLREKVRTLLTSHLKKVSDLMISDPMNNGQSLLVKVPDEKTKNMIIRALREAAEKDWNKPAEPTLFDAVENAGRDRGV